MKPRGSYCRALNIWITVEADQVITALVRRAEDDHGHRRIKQAVVDAVLRVAGADNTTMDKIVPLLPKKP
jgi:hypothetical protein